MASSVHLQPEAARVFVWAGHPRLSRPFSTRRPSDTLACAASVSLALPATSSARAALGRPCRPLQYSLSQSAQQRRSLPRGICAAGEANGPVRLALEEGSGGARPSSDLLSAASPHEFTSAAADGPSQEGNGVASASKDREAAHPSNGASTDQRVPTARRSPPSPSPGLLAPGSSGVTLEDLLPIIKNAEKNILELNRVRVRALEELSRAQQEKKALQLQVKLLHTRLAEAEARATLVPQLREETGRLESEVAALQEEATRRAEQLAEEQQRAGTLSEEVEELGRRLAEGQSAEAARAEQAESEVLRLREAAEEAAAEQQRAQQQVQELQARLAVTEAQSLATAESETEKVQQLQARVDELVRAGEAQTQEAGRWKEELEGQLEEAEAGAAKLAAEKEGLIRDLQSLQADLGEQGERLQQEVLDLEQQLSSAQASAAELEQRVEALRAESESSEAARLEAEQERQWLWAQNAVLEERLQEKVALETAELEAQSSLLEEGLRSLQKALEANETQLLRSGDDGNGGEGKAPLGPGLGGKEGGAGAESNGSLLQSYEEELSGMLEQMEEEKGSWRDTAEENLQLREQMDVLLAQLALSTDSLALTQEQLLGKAEEEEESLGLAPLPAGVVPVDEHPWEFWSDLLLRIDTLLLEKRLTKDEARELHTRAWKRNVGIRDAYMAVVEASNAEVAPIFKDLVRAKTRPGLHIVHIAAEMAPVAKVGGLGDVVTGLGRALQKKGHLVEVVLPKYDCMDYSRIVGLQVMDYDLMSYFDGQQHKSKVWRGIVEGLPVYFIEPLHPSRFFWRNCFYGEGDDFARFTFFCRAALEFLHQAGKQPDIIHGHDWQTAAIAPLYWDVYFPLGFASAQVVFTCHNFEYQGTERPGALASCGLDVAALNRPDRMQDNFMPDRINLLKGALVYANLVTTVSPTYADEVRNPEGGRGLQVTLAALAPTGKFHGILNGIDGEVWDPALDAMLEVPFSAERLEGKRANKTALRSLLGLADTREGEAEKPLVGCITRLVPQKGVHLIRHAIYHIRDRGGQFVLLGSSPVPDIQRDFEHLSREFAQHPDVRLVLKYDERLSHRIYGGADMLIIPSLFEPCGLTQLIALRYGVIPIVRKTGGLADSVFDVDDESVPEAKKNGFCFSATDTEGFNYAMDRALYYFSHSPEWWLELQGRAMRMDFTWEESAGRYAQLYLDTVRAPALQAARGSSSR
eukprot:TRINITY_DN2346_c1_g1_i1.p1 TRINITY_DN2346_c1_g1~~TRINITY_DN2346_c1_g1_i1.p1  ORF type:complete len:1210 (+),score=398.35 TRINITY_DN2346_c1_g1_i1:1220-4849(+)